MYFSCSSTAIFLLPGAVSFGAASGMSEFLTFDAWGSWVFGAEAERGQAFLVSFAVGRFFSVETGVVFVSDVPFFFISKILI